MRVRLKGVYGHSKRLSDGTTREYWTLRGVGALKPLEGDEHQPFAPGSQAFMRAYTAAIDAPRVARTAGTLQSIIAAYQRSVGFQKLAPRTKLDYTSAIARIEAKWGAYPLDAIEVWRDNYDQRSASIRMSACGHGLVG